jgi:hypothetical protein
VDWNESVYHKCSMILTGWWMGWRRLAAVGSLDVGCTQAREGTSNERARGEAKMQEARGDDED